MPGGPEERRSAITGEEVAGPRGEERSTLGGVISAGVPRPDRGEPGGTGMVEVVSLGVVARGALSSGTEVARAVGTEGTAAGVVVAAGRLRLPPKVVPAPVAVPPRRTGCPPGVPGGATSVSVVSPRVPRDEVEEVEEGMAGGPPGPWDSIVPCASRVTASKSKDVFMDCFDFGVGEASSAGGFASWQTFRLAQISPSGPWTI